MLSYKDGLVSVILPFYKAGKWAGSIAKSIDIQKGEVEVELFVIDDGLGEGLDSLVEELRKLGIPYNVISTSGRCGPGYSRNLGLEKSQGRYVAFLDADDAWPSGYLKKSIDKIHDDFASLTYVATKYYDEDGRYINCSSPPKALSFSELIQTCPVSLPGVVIDRYKTGRFEFNITGHEDYQLWLEFSSKGHSLVLVEDAHVKVTRAAKSASSNKFKAVSWQWNAIKKYSNSRFILRVVFIFVYLVNAVLKRKCKLYKPVYLPLNIAASLKKEDA